MTSALQIYCILPLVLYIAERIWRLLRNVAFKVPINKWRTTPISLQSVSNAKSITR